MLHSPAQTASPKVHKIIENFHTFIPQRKEGQLGSALPSWMVAFVTKSLGLHRMQGQHRVSVEIEN